MSGEEANANSPPPPPPPQQQQPNSDNHHPPHINTLHSADENFTISQLIRPKNIPSSPSLASPLISSLGKRRKSKPVRFDDFTVTFTPSRHTTTVDEDSAIKSLSSLKGNSNSKDKTPPAMIKAAEVQARLGTKYPSYIKMVKAQVDSGYWMGFPMWFGKLHLPKTDSEMEIEDEDGEICIMKYNSVKSGLSSGWKKFSVDQNLLEGDVLVFHLVAPYKFKVYIVRANDLNKVDAALKNLSLETLTEQTIPETDTPSPKTNKTKRGKSLSSTGVLKKHKLSTPSSHNISQRMEQSGNNSEENGSEVLEGSRPAKSNFPFQEVNTFNDFHIMVNGTCLDSELPDDVRMSYFRLCMDRKEFLHDGLPDKFYSKLVIGMIGETVNIANAIRNCKFTTTKEEFNAWDNALKSFALMGMKVGFLRDRILKLLKLVSESEGRLDIQRYMEAEKEQKRIEDKIERLTEEVKKLKESSRKTKCVVDGLKQKVGSYEVKFQEEVNAPW